MGSAIASSQKSILLNSSIIQDTLKDVQFLQNKIEVEKKAKIINEYTLLDPPIAKNPIGQMSKAVHKVSKITRQVKIIYKNATRKNDQIRIKEEAQLMSQLDHPNIIKMYDFYSDRKNFYLITELCVGGTLFDRIMKEKFFSELEAASIMKQILSAVNYLHQSNILHRDLKPEIMMFDSPGPNGILKLYDFGISRSFQPGEILRQKTGTPYYMAPEVLRRKYTEKCDIWSCGVILYILLCGGNIFNIFYQQEPPFNGYDEYTILQTIMEGGYLFTQEIWKTISDEAKRLVSQMLQKGTPLYILFLILKDTSKRLTAQQALQDKWILDQTKVKNVVNLQKLQKALNNMSSFRAEKKLQEAALVFMINYIATKDEKNELLQQFHSLDLNGDGKLSREELIQGFSKFMDDKQKTEEEVDKIMKYVDKNDSGAIDYSEFVLATINKEKLMEQSRLELAFKMFDKDGSGLISTDEIRALLGGNQSIPDMVWNDIIKEVDENGDGEISYEEFKEMMIKIAENDILQLE